MDDGTAQRLDLGSNSDEGAAEAAAPAVGRSSDLRQPKASGGSAAPAGARSLSRLIRETKQAPPHFDKWTLLPMEDEATASLQRVMKSEAQLRERVSVLTEMYEGARILAEAVPSLKAELKALQKERASLRSERARLRKELAGLRKECDELPQLRQKGTKKEQRCAIDEAVAAALAKQAAELEAEWSAKMERALAAKEAECIEELTQLLSEKRVMQNRVVARAAHRLQSALAASALSGWIDYVDQKKGALAAMRKVTQRILMMGCARALSAWTQFVEERKRTVRKVIKRILLSAIARAFDGWRHAVARQLRSRSVIRKLKDRMQHRVVQVSFGSWYDWCHVNKGLVVAEAAANTGSQTPPVYVSMSGGTRARGTQTKRVANPDESLSRHCACCPASHVNVLYSGEGGSLSLAFTTKALADARSAYYAVAATDDERREPEPESEPCLRSRGYVGSEDSAGAVAAVTIDDSNPKNDEATVFVKAERPIYQATQSVAVMSSYAPGGTELRKCNIGDRVQLSEIRTGKNRAKRGRITGGREGWVTIQLPSGKTLLTPASRTEKGRSQSQPWPPTAAKQRSGSKARVGPLNASAEPAATGVVATATERHTERQRDTQRDRDRDRDTRTKSAPAAAAAVQSRRASPTKPRAQRAQLVSPITGAEETAELPAAVTLSPRPGYSTPTQSARSTPQSQSQLQSPPRTPAAPTRQSSQVTQDERQDSSGEEVASEHMRSVGAQVLKAGYLDKQLRQQQPLLEETAAKAKQPTASDIDGVWKQRYVELVVGTSTSTQTGRDTETQRQTESQETALTRARLVFRQSPGGRELGTVLLLPPSREGSSGSAATAAKSAASSEMAGTRIVRSSRRRHQHSNAVWSVVTVENVAGDSSSRQVSFRALDHDIVSAWCSAMESALEMVADEQSRHEQESAVSEEEVATASAEEDAATEKNKAEEQAAAADEKEQTLAEKQAKKKAPARQQQPALKTPPTRGPAAAKRTDSRRSTRGRR